VQALFGNAAAQQLPGMLLCYQEGEFQEREPAVHDFVLGVHSLEAKWLLAEFGDVIYVDATYGVNRHQHPNFAVMVVDSLNHGHLVASFLVMREATADVTVALRSLKQYASPWQPQAVVMDKSDAANAAVQTVWPGCKVVVCRWHAMRAVEEFCRPRLQRHTAVIKYQLCYLMRARTVQELEHLAQRMLAEGYFQQLDEDITRDDEVAIATYFRRYWLESDGWREASFDCFVGEMRCGGTNMHIESFFRHSKDAFGGSKGRRKRELHCRGHLGCGAGTSWPSAPHPACRRLASRPAQNGRCTGTSRISRA
jgi:hypothetical protein